MEDKPNFGLRLNPSDKHDPDLCEMWIADRISFSRALLIVFLIGLSWNSDLSWRLYEQRKEIDEIQNHLVHKKAAHHQPIVVKRPD